MGSAGEATVKVNLTEKRNKTYVVEHLTCFLEAGKTLLQQGYLLVSGRSEDVP